MAFDAKMRFETCAICEVEHGSCLMTSIDDSVLRRIGASGIGPAYDDLVKVLEEPPTQVNKYEQAYARAVERELFRGEYEYRGLLNKAAVKPGAAALLVRTSYIGGRRAVEAGSK